MDYFEARGVDVSMYEKAKLPAYFNEVLENLDFNARILDFGCGFGQHLEAIKNCNFAITPKMGGGA
ncbi:hypothetical protein [Helicobacter sp. MIT 14-3879]|uniref:hypothetical protein n=1 Tax=Helicobacter sp. MIT 14-3879 TaxID=2040649 RepID=UPI000E1ED028|nr:hypothetical protein [Helicobacter sp. MIT 14-3879]RDU65572.1 hypothetical protein CQA44_00930 [Helicobacter sp. MIT 14-3879]